MLSLLSVKLHRPAPPPRSIRRPALMMFLNDGLALGRPMTLISAPAGFGKTTCAGEWLSALDVPVVWLSLDSDDNDPGRFFSYLAAALDQLRERLGPEAFSQMRQVEAVLRAGQLPPQEVVTGALLAACCNAPSRFLLVLDDFHLIQERFILQVFEKLIASLFQPHRPQPLHLVLLGREDPSLPLARLRANDQLTEIRAADLRFSGPEAADFLNTVMGLGLAASDIEVLTQRTEGWIAGLQLAGLSIRGRSDPSGFIHRLSGSQRFILSYLTEEVLNRQSEDLQQFLLDTAVLDRLNADLCNALTGRGDSHHLLEQMWNANLFLIPLDDEQRWYRYHHLFGDLLRSRQVALQSEKTTSLHRRASQWFAQAAGTEKAPGERAALVGAGVQHALAGQDFALAVQLIQDYGLEILNQWYAKTVMDWIQALPREWSEKNPRINLAFARFHLIHGDFAQVTPYLLRLEALFSGETAGEIRSREPALTAEWLALQSTMANAQGQPGKALELAQQALALAPEMDLNVLSQVYLALAIAYQQMDDVQRAEAAYRQLIQMGRSSSNLIAELLGISALALMLIERGRLHDGFELARHGAEQIERSGVLPPICAGLYGELGEICFRWNQLEQAERYLQSAAQVSVLAGFSDAEIYYAVARSRLCLIRGDVEGAVREVRTAADNARVDSPVVVREEIVAQQVRAFLAQDNLAAAEQLLIHEFPAGLGGPLPALDPGQRITYPQGVLYISLLRGMLYRARAAGASPAAQTLDSMRAALEWSDRLLAVLSQRQYVPLMLSTLLVRAQLATVLGDAQAGLSGIRAALDLAEPEGYISDFVLEGPFCAGALSALLERAQPGSARARFITRILATYPGWQPAPEKEHPLPSQAQPPDGYFEALTEREQEVLRLMAEGHTYDEIAGKMVVSINTVRTHIKSIYGKLGVNNRTTAIDMARRLHIL